MTAVHPPDNGTDAHSAIVAAFDADGYLRATADPGVFLDVTNSLATIAIDALTELGWAPPTADVQKPPCAVAEARRLLGLDGGNDD